MLIVVMMQKLLKTKKEQIYVRFICNAHQKYGIQEKSLMDLRRLKNHVLIVTIRC